MAGLTAAHVKLTEMSTSGLSTVERDRSQGMLQSANRKLTTPFCVSLTVVNQVDLLPGNGRRVDRHAGFKTSRTPDRR